jgi:hypothetical protein
MLGRDARVTPRSCLHERCAWFVDWNLVTKGNTMPPRDPNDDDDAEDEDDKSEDDIKPPVIR